MVSKALCITDLVFEGRPIRLIRNGELWFVLSDVCQALELTNVTETARRLADDEKGFSTIETLGGPQEVAIVSEPGLYKLIATSRKPVAVRFDRWVRHEILPSIRKTGSYGTPSLVPPEQIQAIGELFDQKLQPIARDISEIRRDLKQVGGNVVHLAIKGRKPPSAETQRIHGQVIRYHYYGKCPCGECDVTIMDNDGFISDLCDYHHQFNRWDNRPTATVPLARDCHERIERDAEARTRFGLKAWVQFQSLLSRLPPRQPQLPFPRG